MENAITLVRGWGVDQPKQRLALVQDEEGVIREDSDVSWRRGPGLDIDDRSFERGRHMQYSHPFVTNQSQTNVAHEGFGNSICEDRFALFQDPSDANRCLVVPFDASYTLKVRATRRSDPSTETSGTVERLRQAHETEAKAKANTTAPCLFPSGAIDSSTGVSNTCFPSQNNTPREDVPYNETSFINAPSDEPQQEWSWTPPPSP